MKEHGIIFSAPMVRAIIEGRKTQTRRMVKAEKLHEECGKPVWDKAWIDGNAEYPYLHVPFDANGLAGHETTHRHYCPHPVGTRLWVRETAIYWTYKNGSVGGNTPVLYQDDKDWPSVIRGIEQGCPYEVTDDAGWWKKRPSIHMPRWASRITLEVTVVKVERLQSIIALDAIAEGWPSATKNLVCCKTDPPCMWELATQGDMAAALPDSCEAEDAIEWFSDLWISINGEDSWESNPWCWCYTFKVLEIKK